MGLPPVEVGGNRHPFGEEPGKAGRRDRALSLLEYGTKLGGVKQGYWGVGLYPDAGEAIVAFHSAGRPGRVGSSAERGGGGGGGGGAGGRGCGGAARAVGWSG